MQTMFRWVLCAAMGAACAQAQVAAPFSIREALSAPYALGLTAAPTGERFAWIENLEGTHNIWVGGPAEPAHAVTRYAADDGQDITALTWSLDGKSLAYVLGAETGQAGAPANPAHLQRDTERQLWVVRADNGSATQIPGGGMAPLFAHDGKHLLFTRKGKIFSVPLNEPASAQELVWDRGIPGSLTLSPDGRLLAFVSRRKDHSFIGLFDLDARILRFAAPGTGIDTAPAFSRDGKTLYWLRRPFTELREFIPHRSAKVSWQVMAADLASPDNGRVVWQPTANKPGSAWPHLATGEPFLLPTAGGTVLVFAETDGWLHLYAVREGQPAATLLTPGAFEVEDARLSPDGATLWWASNDASADKLDADRRHLWRLDMSAASANAKPAVITRGAGIETRPVISGDGKVIAAVVADAHVPMHVALVNSAGTMQELHPNALPATYPAQSFVTPQQVVFPARLRNANTSSAAQHVATLPIHGQLFLPATPATDGKRPALVFFHGGPHRQMLLGYPAMEYYSQSYALNQYFAARGYVVLSVNYRCGVGYGLDFRECENTGAAGASEYNDALAAVEYLRRRGDIDMHRVGIWGGSYGGYFTALGLARNSNLFRAGVDFHGVHDWVLEDNAATDWLKGTNAEKDAIAAKARISSPIADVRSWRSPVLLIHGDDDANVTFVQTPLLAEALRERGVHVEELVFPDEIHEFLLHRDWLKAYEAADDFFRREMR